MTAREAFYEQRKADLYNRIYLYKKLEESYRKSGEVMMAHRAYKEAERLEKQLKDLAGENATVTANPDDELSFNAEGTI